MLGGDPCNRGPPTTWLPPLLATLLSLESQANSGFRAVARATSCRAVGAPSNCPTTDFCSTSTDKGALGGKNGSGNGPVPFMPTLPPHTHKRGKKDKTAGFFTAAGSSSNPPCPGLRQSAWGNGSFTTLAWNYGLLLFEAKRALEGGVQ